MGGASSVIVAIALEALLLVGAPSSSPVQDGSPVPAKNAPSANDKPSDARAPQRVAGMMGFQSVSSIVYDEAPGITHRLTATYMFPDRARWFLGVKDEKSTERQMRYRFHEKVFSIDPRTANSSELAEDDCLATLQQMELRRATMLWPDGFDWRISGEEARVDLGSLGSFRARFEKPIGPADLKDQASAQRPIQVISQGAKGEEIESFRALTWKERGNRRWPATAELWHAGKRVWREQVESIDATVHFVDSFFLPADRRELQPPARPQSGTVQPLDLPETASLRSELKTGATWESALLECSKLREQWEPRLKAQGLELDPKTTFELSAEARPAACVLRLSSIPPSLPPEFVRSPSHPGVAMLVDGIDEVTPERLSTLARSAPRDARGLAAYLRFDREQIKSGPILIVLPLAQGH
jgi:hypothetical protein